MKDVYVLDGGGSSDDPGVTHRKILSILTKKFRASENPSEHVRLVGLLFGRPELKLVKNEILPNLEYWHHRSGENVDFFCAGFTTKHNDFSPAAFNRAVRYFEQETEWRYSGGTDLILLNSMYDSSIGRAVLNYSSAVVLPLELAVKEGAINNLPVFFEKIVAHAEKSDGTDPTWGLSDSLGAGLVKNALLNLLLSLIPKSIRSEAKRAFFFAVKSIAK